MVDQNKKNIPNILRLLSLVAFLTGIPTLVLCAFTLVAFLMIPPVWLFVVLMYFYAFWLHYNWLLMALNKDRERFRKKFWIISTLILLIVFLIGCALDYKGYQKDGSLNPIQIWISFHFGISLVLSVLSWRFFRSKD